MEGKAGHRDRVPSDYATALGRDPVLAPPTCCCCCCCCTLVVPEASFGNAWANKVMDDYAAVHAYPPYGEVMKAYAGGIVAGNLIFWIVALMVGFPLVLLTVGIVLIVAPVALLLVLALYGGQLGARVARARGEDVGQGRLTGVFIGLGMAVLCLASTIGIGLLVFAVVGEEPSVLLTPFTVLGIAGVAGAVAMLVLGLNARRDARLAKARQPQAPVFEFRKAP